ncbi:MAG TPA: glycine--tRNA ligase [Candidatus Hydrogenedentes bacterium]|nr:glycine--tRNA ligase [Candidatus Hydrogenedentota bacterium]HOJ69113.1 glycine--tRNA ligase [Candidatus Hydrogenedentota bacterium]HOK89181.1 glycine--tRNA ligase [Candidatus Hydrogenedentota bacterium]
MDKVVSLCKRKGFIFQSSGIYGGINGCWDFGPLGVELKRNLKNDWWYTFVQLREDMVGLDASIITHPQVWVASGHVENFHDMLVDCKSCKKRFRADHVESERCPDCGGELTEPRAFNSMLRTRLGVSDDTAVETYLRPETCQSIFVDFKEVYSTARVKLPFGIAQIGKSFRNEVNPRNFIFRSREFEQMEIEYFCREEEEEQVFASWQEAIWQWYLSIGLKETRMRWYEHPKESLAHYSKRTVDVEYEFPFGWGELQGLANRGTFDLTQHSKHSGKDLRFFDPEKNERLIPTVIEPSAGVDRTILALLCEAYDEEEVEGETRVVMRFSPRMAPIKAGVFPLVKKGGLAEVARELELKLRRKFPTVYDDSGAIGRRYRRQDEIGTPYCVCVDFETLENGTVTIRDRDTMEQVRLPMDQVAAYIGQRVSIERD